MLTDKIIGPAVLAARRIGGRSARAELCGGLQHSLAAAGNRPFGPEGGFFAPVFDSHDRNREGQINVCSTGDSIDALYC